MGYCTLLPLIGIEIEFLSWETHESKFVVILFLLKGPRFIGGRPGQRPCGAGRVPNPFHALAD